MTLGLVSMAAFGAFYAFGAPSIERAAIRERTVLLNEQSGLVPGVSRTFHADLFELRPEVWYGHELLAASVHDVDPIGAPLDEVQQARVQLRLLGIGTGMTLLGVCLLPIVAAPRARLPWWATIAASFTAWLSQYAPWIPWLGWTLDSSVAPRVVVVFQYAAISLLLPLLASRVRAASKHAPGDSLERLSPSDRDSPAPDPT